MTQSEVQFLLAVQQASRARLLRQKIDLSFPLSPLALEQLIESAELRSQLMDRVLSREQKLAIPTDRIPLIGRSKLMGDVQAHLHAGQHLVTLVGLAGSGKSRIAREILRHAQREGRSTWFLNCSHIEDPDSLAREFGMATRHRSAEHTYGIAVLDGLGPDLRKDLGKLLRSYPNLQFLVTSRAALRLGGEMPVRVGYLSHSASGDLLGAAAQDPAARSMLRVAPRMARLPLALILAGSLLSASSNASTPWLFPDEQLIQKLGSQETIVMEAIRRLDDSALGHLICLSTFQGPFGRSEAEEIVLEFGQTDTRIEPLVSLSLVDQASSEGSYVLHDEVKRRVQEVAQARGVGAWLARAADAHALVFARLAASVAGAMGEGNWASGMAMLSSHRANYRAALRHLEELRQFEPLKQISSALSRGLFEAGYVGDFREFARLGMEAAISTRDERVELELLGLQGALAGRYDDEEAAKNLWARRLAIAERAGDLVTASDALEDLAHQAYCTGEHHEAQRLARESLRLCELSGHLGHRATALCILGRSSRALGEEDQVAEVLESLEGLIPKCEDKALLPFIRYSQAGLYIDLGDLASAEESLRALLRLALEGDRVVGLGWGLRNVAELFEGRGDTLRAAQCFAAASNVHNEYATRHAEKARAALEAFEDRHGLEVAHVIHDALARPWRELVEELLG